MAEFCSHRMVSEYQTRFYVPAVKRRVELLADNAQEAKKLSILHSYLKKHWGKIRVDLPNRDHDGPFQVGDTFTVSAGVHLGIIEPDKVDVELYYGRLQSLSKLTDGITQTMEIAEDRGNGDYLYQCTVVCKDSGRYGFTVRVAPRADDWIRFTPGLLSWA
jgi:starch phosphorylase